MKPREIEKNVYLLNGTSVPVADFQPEHITRGPAVYEVIQVMDGVPLFWEAHLDRLNKSLSLAGASVPLDRQVLHRQMRQLIRENQVDRHNFKIVVTDFGTSTAPTVHLFFITSRYPSEDQLKNGVDAITHHAERENPNAKIIATDFRAPIQDALHQADAYEALLVNRKMEVTEGSRSNFFLFSKGTCYTPPSDQILQGITRQVVINLLGRLSVPLVQQHITLKFLKQADALFITGTSPGVLPIRRLDGQDIPSGTQPPLQQLQQLYHHFTRTYIAVHRDNVE